MSPAAAELVVPMLTLVGVGGLGIAGLAVCGWLLLRR